MPATTFIGIHHNGRTHSVELTGWRGAILWLVLSIVLGLGIALLLVAIPMAIAMLAIPVGIVIVVGAALLVPIVVATVLFFLVGYGWMGLVSTRCSNSSP